MTTPEVPREITTTSVVVASSDQVSSDLAGESILMSLRTGMYYGLDEVGARVWELVREPRLVSDIRDVIAGEYEVERDRCERDILGLLRELAAQGLIEVK